MARVNLRIFLLLVSVTVLSSPSDAPESSVMGSHDPVLAKEGSEVILPCHLEPPFNVSTLTVQWKRGEETVHASRDGKDDLDEQSKTFKDRTQLFHHEMASGDISLKISNVSKDDAGNYTCSVPKLESQVRKDNVQLKVEPENMNNSSKANVDSGNKVNNTDTGSKSVGEIIGIVVGVLVGIFIFIGIAFFIWKKYRAGNQRNPEANLPRDTVDPNGTDQEQVPLNEFNNARPEERV